MKLSEGIRKHGFRKWYERELMQSHVHLVLCFLCSIGLLAAFEGLFTFRGLGDKLIDLASVALCVSIGYWALRRYLYLLMYAEAAASQAQCPQCDTFARFELLGERRDGSAEVRCRKCQRAWHISV